MAEIIKGKNKDMTVHLMQWCNDWFMVDPVGIVSPTTLRLTKEEVEKVRTHANNGIMFGLFTLSDEGEFKRIRRKRG